MLVTLDLTHFLNTLPIALKSFDFEWVYWKTSNTEKRGVFFMG